MCISIYMILHTCLITFSASHLSIYLLMHIHIIRCKLLDVCLFTFSAAVVGCSLRRAASSALRSEYTHTHIYVSIYAYVYTHIYIFTHTHIYIDIFIHPSIYLSIHLSIFYIHAYRYIILRASGG